PELIRARYEHLLARCATVEKAELRIDRVAWRTADADGYPARVRLLVRGTRADGMRAELVQAATLRVAQRDGRWRITREEVTARTLVTRRTPRFARATDAAGLASVHTNDGWPDLFVAAARGGDRLFHNTGGGHFVDVSAAAGIPPGRWASMAAVADYDRDGFLDLYVVRMGDQEATVPRPNYAATNGVPSTLYRNNGDGTFTDVTRHARVGNTGWGMAAAWADYDGDGWPDLYVANEFGG